MKVFRFHALFASLTIAAAACMPVSVRAEDATPAGTDRGVRLDELFTMFKKETPPVTQTQSPSAAKPSTDDTAARPPIVAHNHAGKTHKQPGMHVAKLSPKHAASNSQLAIYKNNSSANDMVAVSHSVLSNNATGVISATLDRPGTVPKYKAGDHMVIKLKALQDCNVMVFDFDNKGTLTQLFPNEYDRDGAMHSGQNIELGGESSQYTLDIGGNGMERIFVYAVPLAEGPITVAMSPVPHTPFRSVAMTRDQYDRMIAKSATYAAFDTPATSMTREVRISGKTPVSNASPKSEDITGSIQPVSSTQSSKPANKLELYFQIDK